MSSSSTGSSSMYLCMTEQMRMDMRACMHVVCVTNIVVQLISSRAISRMRTRARNDNNIDIVSMNE